MPPRLVFEPPRGRALCLAPHPDDEILGCGGALALHRARGDAVRVVVAFDGALGLELGQDPALRRAESHSGGALLGLDDFVFLDAPEGHAPTHAELAAGAARLRAELERFAPDVVYLPWDDDEHVDHRTLAAAGTLALAGFAGQVWRYEVWSELEAEVVLDVGGVRARLREALACHASQLARGDVAARHTARLRARGTLTPSGWGEAYRSGGAA